MKSIIGHNRITKLLSIIAPAGLSCLLLPGYSCTAAESPPAELQKAEQVRRLTTQEAERHVPVRLRGVVTFFDEGLYSHFVQDDTAGIYLNTSTNLPPLVPGQLVEVEGVTGAGEFAPVVLPSLVKVLGQEGFTVLGAHEVLTEAVAPNGLLTDARPDAQAIADIRRGAEVARALGSVDVGQGCVVQAGLVLCVEAIEGTDAMLSRAASLRRPGPGGVLVKLVKPGQDRRADLPTIGPSTVRNAAAAGLRGIAFEAGGTLLAERATTIMAAEQSGLFLLGFAPDQPIG